MQGDEYKSLYDYEMVIREFPASEEYETAVLREMEIAQRYLDGLRRKLWGLIRVEPARRLGEELMIRVQERLPGSRVSEEAAIRLAEHYYQSRDLALAKEMFDIFQRNYPDSEYAKDALLGQIYANVAQFKGPEYDASGLIEAELLLDRFVRRYPADALRSGIAEGLGSRIDESRAQQMLSTADWYLDRRGRPVGPPRDASPAPPAPRDERRADRAADHAGSRVDRGIRARRDTGAPGGGADATHRWS
jgi:hypothetical protein